MDPHTSPSLGTPAPYGHACANCSQSKCKCIIRQAGGPCERCRRLNKECHPAETVRRRNSRKPVASKTTQLEKKIDGLVSLIKAGAQSGAVIVSSHAMTAVNESTHYQGNANIPTRNQLERVSVLSSSNNLIHDVPFLTPPSDNITGSPYNPPTSDFDTCGEPRPVEAAEYLINFQTYKSKQLPFLYIPSTIRAQQLRHERPFLYMCIMAVSSKSTSQQQALVRKIRQTVAQEIVVQCESNIDLLLGLLIFIGWAHYQIQRKSFLAVFTQLAVSLVFELGLNKPVPKDNISQALHCGKEKYSKPQTPRTMEERRAVLGCFLITSIISSFLQKIDALRWTPYMDECLQILNERKECSNDDILVQQVRLQLILETIAPGTLPDGEVESTEHIRETSFPPLEIHHSQLHAIKTQLLSQPKIDDVVLLHLYSTELDITLSPTFFPSNHLTFQQRESLHSGLESINSWFEVFFRIPLAAYIGFPFSIVSQLFRCITTLYRLKTLDDRGWDEKSVCKMVDPLHILDAIIRNLEQAVVVAGLDNSGDSPDTDVLSRTAQSFRSLRLGWEAKMAPHNLSTIPVQRNDNVNFLPEALSFEFIDNDWLMDLLPPNY